MLSTKRHESSRLVGDELIQSELNPFCVRVRQEARMETLNLSDSTPRSESRLKSLFWPSIQNGADVDYLGTPGYWVCTLLAIVSFIFSLATGEPVVGAVMLLFYYLGGVGVRERSRYAAAIILCLYVSDTLVGIECGQGNLWSFANLEPARDLDCFSLERRFRRSDLTAAT